MSPSSAKAVNRVSEDVEALFHDDTAEEGDHHLVVGDPDRTAPGHVAAVGIELLSINATGPDGDVAVHPLRP